MGNYWISNNDRYLLHYAKQPGTFHSSRWRRDYNPDLCFTSKTDNRHPLYTSRKILPHFPHHQHRPALIHIGVQIPVISSKPLPRWNFRKADWKGFTQEVEEKIIRLEPVPKNYKSFCMILKAAAKNTFPEASAKTSLLAGSEDLLKQYEATGDPDIATELLDPLDAARRQHWQETVDDLNFTHSSRKAWTLPRHLGSAAAARYNPPKVSANAVASCLLANSKVDLSKKPDMKQLTAFHLSNRLANAKLQVSFCGKPVKNEEFPKYLGVTLDRTLTYHEHLKRVADNLKARVNIIRKLAGNSWGSNAHTLRPASLALVYSTAEFCSTAWANSCYTKELTLSFTLQCGIRRREKMLKDLCTIEANPDLPIHDGLYNLPNMRLTNTNPSVKSLEDFDSKTEWRSAWTDANTNNGEVITDPTVKPPRFHLPRKQWLTLNRIWTLHATTAHHLHKWGMTESPACDCRYPDQTIPHIVNDCSLRLFPGCIKAIHTVTDAALA
ncbi:hypothetical protein SKAU_G00193080 [Synaphobranchus kaupii]|uniref:Reverse transcriptase n=1 Tax=Synaphobranchus kaupii TaxID=118154 RepID=A0A9Q1IWJ7_SYNKA|nr:hypothetical protein SKAU_G00193080 [Synaphobranchus kaupii]